MVVQGHLAISDLFSGVVGKCSWEIFFGRKSSCLTSAVQKTLNMLVFQFVCVYGGELPVLHHGDSCAASSPL